LPSKVNSTARLKLVARRFSASIDDHATDCRKAQCSPIDAASADTIRILASLCSTQPKLSPRPPQVKPPYFDAAGAFVLGLKLTVIDGGWFVRRLAGGMPIGVFQSSVII